jgi:hypothetical protein
MRDSPGLFALLVLDAALLGAFGLVFTPLHVGAVPLPMGAVLSALVLPWLVHRAAEVDPRPAVAAAPLVVWLATVGVLGWAGPAGDVLLPATWQSLLLVVAGAGSGLWALRGAVADREGGGARHG